MKTTLVNIKDKVYFDEYIGRPTIFGNPYVIGKDGGRGEVIAKYNKWFYRQIDINIIFKREVQKLKGQILGCYCYPLPCHGDVIIKYLDNI